MKKRIEKYFPAAMAAIKKVLQEDREEHVIPREYQGYISAFGASVLQMGLLPTLAVHDDRESGAAKDKGKLLEVLSRTIQMNSGQILSEKARQVLSSQEKSLFRNAVQHPEIRQELADHLLDAAVAVKLCLRTFKLSES